MTQAIILLIIAVVVGTVIILNKGRLTKLQEKYPDSGFTGRNIILFSVALSIALVNIGVIYAHLPGNNPVSIALEEHRQDNKRTIAEIKADKAKAIKIEAKTTKTQDKLDKISGKAQAKEKASNDLVKQLQKLKTKREELLHDNVELAGSVTPPTMSEEDLYTALSIVKKQTITSGYQATEDSDAPLGMLVKSGERWGFFQIGNVVVVIDAPTADNFKTTYITNIESKKLLAQHDFNTKIDWSDEK